MSDHRGTAKLQERLDSIAYLLDRAYRCQVWEPQPVDVREARQWIRRALIVANGATEREMWEAETATRQAGEVLRQLMADNERLRWALETVAGRCPGCRKIAERILAGATIEAALDGAHVPDEEVTP